MGYCVIRYIIYPEYRKWRDSKYQFMQNREVNNNQNLTLKSPEIALLLSLFLFGGGQIYNGSVLVQRELENSNFRLSSIF
jgi:hypothetical protein